jgi:phosphomannomutase
MSVPPEIFKAYDVRGIAGEQIDADVAHRIGRAFARVISDLSGKAISDVTVAVGRDMRLSAPELLRAYRDGIVLEGASVVDLG